MYYYKTVYGYNRGNSLQKQYNLTKGFCLQRPQYSYRYTNYGHNTTISKSPKLSLIHWATYSTNIVVFFWYLLLLGVICTRQLSLQKVLCMHWNLLFWPCQLFLLPIVPLFDILLLSIVIHCFMPTAAAGSSRRK